MEEALVRVVDLCKVYNPGENEVRALDHVNLEIHKGEFVAIIGQSGSGKSTFMNMLGCLDDRPVVLTGFMTLMYRIWRMMSFLMCATVRLDLFFRDSI